MDESGLEVPVRHSCCPIEELDGTAELAGHMDFVAERSVGLEFRGSIPVAVLVVLDDGRIVLESASSCLLLLA